MEALGTMYPWVRRVRGYFAPVNRATTTPVVFDPAQAGGFALHAPPGPWIDLGWIHDFKRQSGTKISAVRSGSPSFPQLQTRTGIDATVSLRFERWGKLQLALSAGTQQLNLLRCSGEAAGDDSGGTALPAVAVASGSTATVLQVGTTAAPGFAVGQMVVVDVDNTGATGYVGSGVSGAYFKAALADVDAIRRVSLNVGRIESIQGGALTLEWPLLAGAPTAAMKVSGVVGFCDREGSSFFQEWSGLFVGEGQQGERVLWHYPRLQTLAGIAEQEEPADGFGKLFLSGAFRALPVQDPTDGETVVCFRSYVMG